MSILERLRKRSGLLVAIVGIALLAFVLTGLFERGSSLFGGSSRAVGEIGGKSIDYNVFNQKVQEALENQKRNGQKTSLTAEETDQTVQQVWNQTINEEVMDKEYAKLGIGISDEELYDLMVEHPHSALVRNLSDQQGKVSQMFADPKTGQVSPEKIKEFTKKMTDEQEGQWTKLEEYIKQVRTVEKYNNLIKKGLYMPSAFAKRDYIAQNSNASIKYVIKNYKLVVDSTIKVNDGDLDKYYKAHQNEFKQEASRKLEYVTFDIAPTPEDFDDAKKALQRVADEFKTKKTTEDSAFVISESETRNFDVTFHTKGTLSPMIDTIMFKADVGTVVGPYLENGAFKISKLEASKMSADSAHVRHILVAYKGSGASQTVTRTKEQAKKMADSLVVLLKKKADFKDFVAKFSDDGGKNSAADPKNPKKFIMGKDGDYGWVNAKSGFVDPFKNAGLDGKKGDLVVVESQFGYHIMEVLDTKGKQPKVQVSTIESKVEPSNKTMQAVFVKASEFAGKNTTNDLFQKSVLEQKLNKRIADNIKENDKTIAGLESPRALVRWAYESKKGMVSEPQEYGDKFVVAALTEVREKGIAPMEQVKDDLTAKVIKEKKAEQFTTEMTAAMAGGATIDAIAAKLKVAVEQVPSVNFNTTAIPGSANEPVVTGTVAAMKGKSMSKPLVGKEGVIVVQVDAKTDAPAQKDYKAQQTQMVSQMSSRVDYEVYDALKKNANVEEHLVRFY
ncbi:MAG: SurA N-terminal domain-containing protein [Bacteroidota bacterium]